MASRLAASVVADAPMTFEALQARTARVPWNPDTRTMFVLRRSGPGVREGGNADAALALVPTAGAEAAKEDSDYQARCPRKAKASWRPNLAQVLVQQRGRRALLIDAELTRAHACTSCSAAILQPGLSDYLLGERDEISVLQQGSMEKPVS